MEIRKESSQRKRLCAIAIIGIVVIAVAYSVAHIGDWIEILHNHQRFWEIVDNLQERSTKILPYRPIIPLDGLDALQSESVRFNKGLQLLELATQALSVRELEDLSQYFPQRKRQAIRSAIDDWSDEWAKLGLAKGPNVPTSSSVNINQETVSSANTVLWQLCKKLNRLR